MGAPPRRIGVTTSPPDSRSIVAWRTASRSVSSTPATSLRPARAISPV